MFLPQVDLGEQLVIQGFVRARWPSGSRLPFSDVTNWSRFFTRSALLWEQLRPLSIGLRVSMSPGQPLVSVHSFVVPAADETALRKVLAAFLRTGGMGDAETEVPATAQDLPANFVHAQDVRLEVVHERLATNRGGGIHFNLRLYDWLPRLLQSMADLGAAVAYEANATEWAPPREMLRSVLVDLARLEEDRAVPADLLRDQRALAARLRAAAVQRPGWHVEECIASAADASAVLDRTAESLLRNTDYGRLGLPPRLRRMSAQKAEAFGHHVHSHLLGGAPAGADIGSVAAAATRPEVDRLVSCAGLVSGSAGISDGGGDPLFLSLGGPPLPPLPPSGGSGVGGGPPRGGGPAPFLFVSYARNDSAAVYPLLGDLERRGVSLWADRHLLGGDDWVAELEARLLDCAGVLALLSPSFAASKYCAREVHFADALNRPILPLALTPGFALGHGLRFLMNTMQIVDTADGQFMDRVLLSIRRHAAETLAAGG